MAVKCSYGTLLTAPSQDVSVSEEHRVEPPATTLPPCLTTPKNPPAFMCVYCGTTFTQKGSANRHYVQETCRKRPPATYLEQQSASKRGRGDRGEVRANTVTAATTGDSSPCFCNTPCLTLYTGILRLKILTKVVILELSLILKLHVEKQGNHDK